MDLSKEIAADLWTAVCASYQDGHYSHAIVDAMHHLSNGIREKSGLDGDGAALVGQALGGETPKLRVNAMKTENERNVQRGLEHIVRGLYLGVRNPRSHDAIKDSKSTADSIIVFVGYLLKLLESAREAFTSEAFVARVIEPEFVESQRYAELLVNEIPAMRRGDALIALYQERAKIDLKRTARLIRLLLSELSEQQKATYLAIVSEQLRIATEESDIRNNLRMTNPSLWPQLDEAARLRIETKLIKGIEQGKSPPSGKLKGALSTWANTFLKVFVLRHEAEETIVFKWMWGDVDDRNYLSSFFMSQLPEVVLEELNIDICVMEIANAIRNNEDVTRKALLSHISAFPDAWQEKLAVALVDQTDADNPAIKLRNGAPFLSSPTKDDDDIPF